MNSFLERLFGRSQTSATQAKERLKLVLVHDRTDLPPAMMDELKNEIITVISRYIEIDPNAVRVEMTQDGREQRLIADIPVGSIRRRKMSSQ